jgi:hypothetical protein
MTHLISHHGKATSLITCPGCLNGGIQGQQVGLIGNITDGGKDVADLVGGGTQILDCRGGLGHDPFNTAHHHRHTGDDPLTFPRNLFRLGGHGRHGIAAAGDLGC